MTNAEKIIYLDEHHGHPGRLHFDDVKRLFKWLGNQPCNRNFLTRDALGQVAKAEFGERGFELYHDLHTATSDYSLPELKGRWQRLRGTPTENFLFWWSWAESNGWTGMVRTHEEAMRPPPPTPAAVVRVPPISATQFKWIEPAQIPQRQWLYGRFLIRGQVSLTVAPGGTGKSIESIVESLALVSNRMLLHDRTYGCANVWLWNGEDPIDELQRRITCAAIHHRIPSADLEEHLFVDSGRQNPINIAYQERNGVIVAVPVFDALVATIKQNKIDVLHVDPLVSSHNVGENDNNAMDAVVKTFARIADVTGAAIHLVHHPRKTGGVAVAADDARGAGALLAGVRAARTMNVMSADEAAKAGVKNRYSFVRIDDAKANLAPRCDVAAWFQIVDVPLGNGALGIGDSTGVVERWKWPDAMEGVTPSDLDAVQAAVAAGSWRESVQAKEWVGKAVAEALGLDLRNPADKAKVNGLVRQWIKVGALVTVTRKDEKRNERSFVEVGKTAETLPPTPA